LGGTARDQSLHGARGGQRKAVLSDSIAADLVKKSFLSTVNFMFHPDRGDGSSIFGIE
jgi:hypothetical protein